MKLVKRGGTWQVHYVDVTGERQRTSTKIRVNPTLPDEGKAMAHLAAFDIVRAALMADAPENVKREAGKSRNLAYALRRTLDEHWERQKSAREKRYVVGQLTREIGYWPLASITYTRLHDYGLEREKEGDSPATRNRKMSAIHTALTHAHRRREIETIPQFPHWAENNVKERYLSREEEARLLKSMADRTAPADTFGLYMMAIVPFLLDTGLRASELMLKPEQDLGDTVWLPHGSTKSGRGRTVPLTTRARECLNIMRASPIHAELLGMYVRDKTIPSQRLGRAFRAAAARAGIAGITLHTLRHTCASRLVQAGVSLYVVKEWLGHSSITVTERYAHLAPKNLAAAASALERATGPEEMVPPSSTAAPPEVRRTVGGTVH